MNRLVMPFTTEAPEQARLRAEVRAYLARERADDPGAFAGRGYDAEFSKRLGARGWLGMVIPARYGGAGRTPLDQFVVAEELLAAGAPIGAHHAAERQTAPMLLRYGSAELRERFLPAIAAGTAGFALGMSEPDSGSDLASVRTRAVPVAGGWRLTGTKVWTSWADRVGHAVVLCRTATGGRKHDGLSQLIVDLRAPGVQVRPIRTLDGRAHFSEVVFDEVQVPEGMLLGDDGRGWAQIGAELAYERGGPDRWLSTFAVYRALVRAAPSLDPPGEVADAVGRCAAWYRVLHELSLGIAHAVTAGREPAVEAAAVKDLGTAFEQRVVELAREFLAGDRPAPPELVAAVYDHLLVAPGFTIRGGSTEILRTIVARELSR
jgi:alkylation response protein AidB-like acyl-CoA dehydrogenase